MNDVTEDSCINPQSQWKYNATFISLAVTMYTVKPALFACPLFREFRNLGDCENNEHKYAIFSVLLSSASKKNAKINGANII